MDVAALERAGIDPAELAEHITELIYLQIFDYGFFHGDPHPGNMLVLPGRRDRLARLWDDGYIFAAVSFEHRPPDCGTCGDETISR